MFCKIDCLKIEKVNFDVSNMTGTCRLTSSNKLFMMVWNIEKYPSFTSGMPGSPYPITFSYTIFDNSDKITFNSISGKFIFKLASGTLPNNCPLGIPYNTYKSLGRNNKYNEKNYIKFSLKEDKMEIHIRPTKCRL